MRLPDESWMERAIALAEKGEGHTRPNPPVGCVVVSGQRAIGEGYHRRAGGPHAEIVALQKAGRKARGATLYVTLEPCSTAGRTGACTDAIIAAGIRRVVAAVKDPNPLHAGRGFRVLRRKGVQVAHGVCEEAARGLIAPFAKWVQSGMPFLTLKLGMSLDGRIGDAAGKSRWITGSASRALVHGLRGRCDAILVGGETARRDNPSLLPRVGSTRPYRVIVSASADIPPGSMVFKDGHADQTIVAVTHACPVNRARRIEASGARVWRIPEKRGHVSLRSLMRRLAKEGLLHVVCEGGGTVTESLVREGLVDQYLFFLAPRLIGGTMSVPSVGGPGWALSRAPKLRIVSCARVGDDVMVRALPEKPQLWDVL